MLIEAMSAEADAGTFEAEKWRPSFPRRTAALIKYRKRVLGEAMAALPSVLVDMVADYTW
jgi:hypothetical protein